MSASEIAQPRAVHSPSLWFRGSFEFPRCMQRVSVRRRNRVATVAAPARMSLACFGLCTRPTAQHLRAQSRTPHNDRDNTAGQPPP
eukprot:412635-Rhodomonas_salina.1